MYIERVEADAFGPLRAQRLELAPGFNVLFGPNEAGKSSWHGALVAGLCGVRRGTGAATREAREFAARFRPWTGDEWGVSVTIVLGNGRRIRISQELMARIQCQAIEVALGRDVSDEILFEGTPDGSKFLGLDRHAFTATACVRQADLEGIRSSANSLQQHIQRAAAARGTDATAATALQVIEDFKRDHVGLARANSNKPLQAAIRRVEKARRELESARSQHEAQIRREADAARAKEEADRLRSEVLSLEAAASRTRLRSASLDLRRAEELSTMVPEEPIEPDASTATDLAAEALASWRAAPDPASLAGASGAELQSELTSLDSTRTEDDEPHTTVEEASSNLLQARQRLEVHEERRPADAEREPAAMSPTELRELASILREPPPPAADTALTTRRDAANQDADRARSRRSPVIVGGLVSIVAAIGLFLVVPVAGGAMLALGISLGVAWALGANRLASAEAALRTVEGEMGSIAYARKAFEDRQNAAKSRLAAVGLPSEPDALVQRAQWDEEAVRAEADRVVWKREQLKLSDRVEAAAGRLTTTLRDRGAREDSSLDARLEQYRRDCKVVRRRQTLEGQLSVRSALEASERIRAAAVESLRQAAREAGIEADAAPEQLAVELAAWQAAVEEAAERVREDRERWRELRTLLRDRSLDDLRSEVEALQATLGTDADEETPRRDTSQLEAAIQRRRQEVRAAKEQADLLAGELAQFVATVPSLPEAEEEDRVANDRLEQISMLEDTLTQATSFLAKAQDEVHRNIAPILAATVNAYLPRVTGARYSHAAVDPKTLEVRIQNHGGQFREAGLLSHGTAEQIYLLLRVALAEHLSAANESCPLLLDDVTVQSDATRTRAILEVLSELSEDRQIILFTQEDDVRDWAEDHLRAPRDSIAYLSLAP